MIRTLVAAAVLIPSAILLLPVFVFAALAVSFTSAVRSIARLIEPSFMLWSDLIAFDRRLGWKLSSESRCTLPGAARRRVSNRHRR